MEARKWVLQTEPDYAICRRDTQSRRKQARRGEQVRQTVCVRVRQHGLKQKAVSARFAASAAAKGNLQRKLFKYFGFCSNLKKATEGGSKGEDPEEKGKKSGEGKKGEGEGG